MVATLILCVMCIVIIAALAIYVSWPIVLGTVAVIWLLKLISSKFIKK